VPEMRVDPCRDGKRNIAPIMRHRFADCKGCGTHLAYLPNADGEAECPNCHQVHVIFGGDLIPLVQTLKTTK